MAEATPDCILRAIRRVAEDQRFAGVPDQVLLRRFLERRDEAAFHALLRRHGPMVLDVCRAVAPNRADAEDAFQAAFLVFLRNARTVRKAASLASWLHGVARRTALKARVAFARRQKHEGRVATRPPAEPDDLTWRELRQVLHEELARLAERYRAPLVLCYLQGKTQDEAAALLGLAKGTLKGRLERGRALLRGRLVRRGLGPGAALLASAWPSATEAAVLPELLRSTVGVARGFVAGGAAARSIPARVAVLTKGVVGPVILTRMTVAVLSLLTVAALGFGGAFLLTPSLDAAAAGPAEGPPEGPPQAAPADPLPHGAVVRLGTTRLRPGGSVKHLAFSPDGTKLASWSNELYVNDSLCVWDVKTGRLLRRVDLPGAGVLSLAWPADGRGLALLQTGEDAKGPLVWELTDEKATPAVPPRMMGGRFGTFAVPGGPVPDNETDSGYAFSPDGKSVVVGRAGQHDKARAIRLRPLKAGARVSELAAGKELARQPGNCGTFLFTPDGKRLVAFNQAKHLGGDKWEEKQLVVVWDLAAGKEVVRFTAPRPAANGDRGAAAVSNRALAIGLEDGGTSLWDIATGKEKKLATAHVGKGTGRGYGTFAVAFAPDGKALYTAGRDELVKGWDVATGKPLRTMARHYSWPEALAVSPDGRTVASAGQDGVIRLWDAASGADACPQPGHLYSVSQAALSPDGKTAVTAGWDGTVRWWDARAGRELRKMDLPGVDRGLTVSPDGRTVVAVNGGRLRTWDLANGRETTPADLPREMHAGGIAFTPDGRQLVVALGPEVAVLDWPGLKLLRKIELPKPAKSPGESACDAVTVSPDGRWLVTVAHRYWYREERGLRFGYGADGVADVWDLTTGKRAHRLADSQGTFRSATFTADGRVVLVGAGGTIPAGGRAAQEFSGEMNLLDPVAARWVRSFTPPPPTPGATHRYTGATRLSPDGRTLYVSYNTGEIVGFEVATGQPRRTLSGHRGYVGALGLTRDGRRLISGGSAGSALVWDLTLAAAAKPRKEALGAADAEKLWETAATGEARGAFAALADLAAAPDQAVELLRRQVKPVPAAPTDAELDRLFKDLDGDDFETRQQASRRLMELGEPAVPAVRKRLERATSAEVRRRAREFLDRFDRAELSPARLRQLRAVELLEGVGTPAAKAWLAELAKGAAGAPLTVDAAAALARLGRR
jgi:RNA polymerase sigma factor (sigma-70 family)